MEEKYLMVTLIKNHIPKHLAAYTACTTDTVPVWLGTSMGPALKLNTLLIVTQISYKITKNATWTT